jgi:O-antigen ligase
VRWMQAVWDDPGHAFRPREVIAVLILLAVILGMLGFPDSVAATSVLMGTCILLASIAPAPMISLVVMSVPVQDSVRLPFFRGEMTLTQIAVAALVIGWVVTFWRYRVWLDGITLGFMGIGAAFLISFTATDDLGLWAGEVYRWVIAALFFVICRCVLHDWPSVQLVLIAIAASVIAVGAFGIGQIAAYESGDLVVGGVLRVFATFGQPNPLAAYVEFTIPLLLLLSLLGFQRHYRSQIGVLLWILSGLATGMGIVILTFTQSRGGMLGFAAGTLIILMVLPIRLRMTAIGAGFLLIAVMAVTPSGQSQLERFSDALTEPEQAQVGSTSTYGTGRSAIWATGSRMFQDELWTGVGAGEFDYHYREYAAVWYDRFPIGQAHNGWLQMGAQAGIPGVVAFTGWLAAALVSLIGAARRSTDPRSRAMAMGALAIMIAFSVHSLVDYLNVLSLGLQLSCVLAVGLNLAPAPLVFAYRRHATVPSTSVAVPLEAEPA